MKKSKGSFGRPPMKQSGHPAHNMPAEQHDGTTLTPDNMPIPPQAMMADQMDD